MLPRKGDDLFNKLIMLVVILAAVEIIFFRFDGLIFGLIFSAVCIYYGSVKYSKFHGKLIFWLGVCTIAINVLSLFVVRLIFFLIVLYILLQYFQKKRDPVRVEPFKTQSNPNEEFAGMGKPVVQNRLFGNQRTSEAPYEWNDINIVTGFGDVVIDLSNTVLPKEESIIFIRNLVGNVEILVPYDVGIKTTHTALFGTASLPDGEVRKVKNQQIMYLSPGFQDATYKVKIVTSLGVGSIRVRWV